jgi:protein phosphatase
VVPSLRDDFFIRVSAKVAARSNLGKKHPRNEDDLDIGSVEVDGKIISWFVVCDGVSRSTNPQLASETGRKIAGGVLQRAALANRAPSEALLREALYLAQAEVAKIQPEPDAIPEYGDPAATIVAAYVKDGEAYIGWCGDSRIYLIETAKSGSLSARLLTRDHTVLNELMDKGGLTLEEAYKQCPSNERHALVQCLMLLPEGEEFAPSFARVSLTKAVCLIGCTDGVWNDVHPMDTLDASRFVSLYTACGGDALNFANAAVACASGVDNDSCAVILL